MVSPQQRHTRVGVLSGAGGKRSMGITGVRYRVCASSETGGSATELSATDAWHEAAVDDEPYLRLIRTIARLTFSQKARNGLSSLETGVCRNDHSNSSAIS
jgi:hypothetical protein